MDPVSAAIIAGLAAGVAKGVTDVGQKLMVDAYAALKGALQHKFGPDSDLVEAVEHLEKKPEAEARRKGVEEEVKAAQADQEPEVLAAAEALLDKLKAQPEGAERVQMIARGSYIAQASHGGTATVNVNQPPKDQP